MTRQDEPEVAWAKIRAAAVSMVEAVNGETLGFAMRSLSLALAQCLSQAPPAVRAGALATVMKLTADGIKSIDEQAARGGGGHARH